MSATQRVVIVGGGITGLAAAFALEQARARGVPVQYTLLEASDHAGGNIRTVRDGDFLIDAGPDGFVVTKPAGAALCKAVGLGEQLIETIPANRRTYVAKGARLIPMPEGMLLVAPTDFKAMTFTPLVSWFGKMRAGIDLFIPKRTDKSDESIASFVRRRLGNEMSRTFAEPMLAGIYSGDPEQLSIQATFPMLVGLETEHGSIIRGAIEQRRKRPGTKPPPTAFLSLRDGMSTLPAAIVSRLAEGAMHFGCAVKALTRVTDAGAPRWLVECANGESFPADDVILAIPPNTASKLLAPHESTAAQTLGAIPQLSTATAFLAWSRDEIPHALDASGFIVPGAEKMRINASTWVTSKWPGRAPDGQVLIRVFFGGARGPEQPELPDDELIAIGREELRRTIGVTATPRLQRVFRYRSSNPQPTVGHLERMADVHQRCASVGGVWVSGGGYDGVGVPDCAKQGDAVVQRVLGSIAARPEVAA